MWKYPGKTLESDGFSLICDYWCDLYKKETPAGKLNPGMLFAKLSTIAAAGSFSLFWIVIPRHYTSNKLLSILMSVCGISAILCSLLLFSGFHNIAIIIGSLLGTIAISVLLFALHKRGEARMFYLGLFALLLILSCNLILYTSVVDLILPILQKISFLFTIGLTVFLSARTLQ